MVRNEHIPEQVINKPGKAEILFLQGVPITQLIKIGINDYPHYYREKEYYQIHLRSTGSAPEIVLSRQ